MDSQVKINDTTFDVGYALTIEVRLEEDYDIRYTSDIREAFKTPEERKEFVAQVFGVLGSDDWKNHPGSVTFFYEEVPVLLTIEAFSPYEIATRRLLSYFSESVPVKDFVENIMQPILVTCGHIAHYNGVWLYQACKSDDEFSSSYMALKPGTGYDDDVLHRDAIQILDGETEESAIQRYIRRGWIQEDGYDVPEDYDPDQDSPEK